LGAFIELSLRALHLAYRALTGADASTSAAELYRPKWDAIPHTRSFASWVMDVLENPFVRLATFLDAETFVGEALDEGFDLYATHPRYDDGLAVEWHKKVLRPSERAARAVRHIRASALSFLCGRKLYVGDEERAATIAVSAGRCAALADRVVAGELDAAAEAAEILSALGSQARDRGVVADSAGSRAEAAAIFESFARAYRCVAAGDAAALRAHTREDAAFLTAWGMPTHFAVGRALRPEERPG
jgi:hypothetical protein